MWHDDDDLESAGDLDIDTREPMRPIRLRYVTLASEQELLTATLERLGLVFTRVGQTMYALNECDSNSIRSDARDALYRAGRTDPSEDEIRKLAEAELSVLVLREKVDRSVSSELVGQLLRAEADVLLATRGHEIRQDVMHRIAEVEADDVEPSRPIYADDDKTEVGRDYSVEADDEMPVPSTTEIAHARREARMFNNHEPWRVLCNRYTEWHESGFSADAWADDSLTYGGA